MKDADLPFLQKLAVIADRAKRKSQRQPAEAATASASDLSGQTGGLSSAVMSALEKAAREAVDQVQDLANSPDRPEPRGRRWSRHRPEPPEDPGAMVRVGQIVDGANDLFIGMTDGNATSPSPSESITDSSATSAVSMTESSSPSWLILACLIVAGCFAWSFFRGSSPLNQSGAGLKNRLVPVETVQSRADIIRAFHALTTRSDAVAGDWLTHERATVALAAERPNAEPAVLELAKLYEQARYQRLDAEMSDAQVEAARQALSRYGR